MTAFAHDRRVSALGRCPIDFGPSQPQANWRVYCQLRLNLPQWTKRRVPQRERQPLLVEPRMNAVWALDFMRDTLYSGRVFRTLNVIDEANRGALGIDVAVSIPATRVTMFLTQMIDL